MFGDNDSWRGLFGAHDRATQRVPNHRQSTGHGMGLQDAADAPPAVEHVEVAVSLWTTNAEFGRAAGKHHLIVIAIKGDRKAEFRRSDAGFATIPNIRKFMP